MTEAERDESLRLFGHRPAEQGEATGWLQPWRRDTERKPPEIEHLPVYDEVFQQLVEAIPIEQRLAGPAPAQVLGAFAPEQRLAELALALWILALPLQVLRLLPEDDLRSLPAEVQEQVRKGLQGTAQGGPRHLGLPTEVPTIAPVFCLHPTLTAPPFAFVQEPARRSTGCGDSTFFAALRGGGPADRQRRFAGELTGQEGAIRALGSGARRAREARPISEEHAARILRRGASWHGAGALGVREYTAAT